MNCKTNIINCHLCANAHCAKACTKLNLSKIILYTWFDNEKFISLELPKANPCINCDAPCEKACISKNVDIKKLISDLYEIKATVKNRQHNYKKLHVDFFGKVLENPFLLSSSVVSGTYDKLARAFEQGWAGAVYKTITYIQINETSPRYCVMKTRINTFESFKNIEQLSQHKPEEDMAIIKRLKEKFPTKIIIASIMGRNEAEWQKLAKMAQDAGADAIELNFSCPNMEEANTGSAIGQQPQAVKKFTLAVKNAVTIPVLAKLTPNVQDMSEAAMAAIEGKANGISAINTIKSIMPKTDTDAITIGGMSGKAVRPIALRFISEIKTNPRFKNLYLSGMGGIETYLHAADFITLGANCLQITTAVMEYGQRIIGPLVDGLLWYLEENNINSLQDLVGSKLEKIKSLDQIERNYVIYPKFDRNKCLKCGRCHLSCKDGGQDALTIGKDGYPVLNAKKCAGCHLCTFVCPSKACTSSGVKVKK